jgi:hypothetical protein
MSLRNERIRLRNEALNCFNELNEVRYKNMFRRRVIGTRASEV